MVLALIMKMNSVLFVLLIVVGVQCQLDVPVVQTTFGAVRGVYEEDDFGQYFMYMGIPYAQTPPGNMFGDPINPTPWEGIFEANDDSATCPQRLEGTTIFAGSIDCLYISVYIPANRTSSEPMPVLYWLFGGAFLFGSYTRNLWGPEFLVSHDIVHVAVNYRVGPFGLLCVGNEEIPGNSGYKDVVQGLRWVRDNIAAFGGDPNQVTIGGCSSGSMVAEFLIASPMAAGLFNKAIMQSGTANTASFNVVENHSRGVVEMASFLGYRGASLDGSIKFLQVQDPQNVLIASQNVDIKFFFCVENEIDGVEAFLTETPIKIIESGNYSAVDVLLGFTSREIPFTIFDVLDESYSTVFESIVTDFEFSSNDERNAIIDIIRSFYIGSNPISEEVRRELEDVQSDNTFAYPTFRSANAHKKNGASVYMYKYEYSGGRDVSKIGFNIFGVDEPMHADDLGYLFKMILFPDEIADNDRLMIDRMTTMWTNFVKYGDPTPEVNDLLPVKWLRMENDGPNYSVRINTAMTLVTDEQNERFAFWDLLYAAYLSLDSSQPYNRDASLQRKHIFNILQRAGYNMHRFNQNLM